MVKENKGVKVRIESTRFFKDQREAREYAIKVLETGVTFVKIEEWEEEVDAPKPVDPPKPVYPEPKKIYKKTPKKDKKKTGPKKGSHNKDARLKYGKEVIEFIKKNALAKPDKALVEALNERFGIDTTVSGLKWQMSQNNITRRTIRKEIAGDDWEEPRKLGPKEIHHSTKKKFTNEVIDFLRDNYKTKNNDMLAKDLKENFGIKTSSGSIGYYLSVNKLSRRYERIKNPVEEKPKETNKYEIGIVHLDHNGFYACNEAVNPNPNKISRDWDKVTCDNCRRKFEGEGVKKLGRSKKYTDEAVQFLRENINNFSNKELCGELNSRFNIKVTIENLGTTMSQKGIKRDHQSDVDPEVIELINKSKEKDAYVLRDEIIEKLEKNIPVRKVINLMNKKSCRGKTKGNK